MLSYMKANLSDEEIAVLPAPWPQRLENAGVQDQKSKAFAVPQITFANVVEIILNNIRLAIRAIIPLTLFLIIMLKVFLRERLARSDIILTGILFSLIGLAFFNIGMHFGLSQLGNQVGRVLPATFRSIPLEEEKQVINNFDKGLVNEAINEDGQIDSFFYYKSGSRIEPLEFNPDFYNSETGQYVYVPSRGPLLGSLGIAFLVLFAFIMGYGATFAEPALNALGLTVEELTIGTFKQSLIMHTVALGVGIGLAFGVAKIIWDIPLMYLLLPPYLIVLALTLVSSEDYVNIGWDSAGVTTGPITVPLVLAMGLGIGTQMGVGDGFGMLALASVWPILTVLLVGVVVSFRRRSFASGLASEEGRGEGSR